MLLTVELSGHLLLQESILVELQEDIVSDVRLQLSCCLAENIETNIEPTIYGGMDFVVFIAELLWCAFLDKRSCLGRRTILIRTYNRQQERIPDRLRVAIILLTTDIECGDPTPLCNILQKHPQRAQSL